MGAINLPYNIANGDDGDADTLMANFETIVAAINGNLVMGANVDAGEPSAPITGKDSSEGVSTSGLRSDAQWKVQGFENATTLPTSGNFLGRRVYITAGVNIGKGFVCTDTTGSGTWLVVENPAAADLVVHAAQHADGQHDPMPDNFLTDHMKAGRTVSSVTQADVGPLTDSTWTSIVDLAITSTGLQTYLILVAAKASNAGGDGSRKTTVGLRLVDVTDSNNVLFRTGSHQLGVSGGGSDAAFMSFAYYHTVPVAGARTLRLQGVSVAAAGTGSTAIVTWAQNGTFAGDTRNMKTLQAVVV